MLIDHVQLLTNVWTASGSDSKTEQGTWKKRIPNSLEYHKNTKYPSELNTDGTSSFSVWNIIKRNHFHNKNKTTVTNDDTFSMLNRPNQTVYNLESSCRIYTTVQSLQPSPITKTTKNKKKREKNEQLFVIFVKKNEQLHKHAGSSILPAQSKSHPIEEKREKPIEEEGKPLTKFDKYHYLLMLAFPKETRDPSFDFLLWLGLPPIPAAGWRWFSSSVQVGTAAHALQGLVWEGAELGGGTEPSPQRAGQLQVAESVGHARPPCLTAVREVRV